MPLKIKQFFYGGDNLSYPVHSENRALAIDGGATDDILTYVRENRLALDRVTNTHSHGDHTQGTRQLAQATGAALLDHRRFADGQTIDLDGQRITVRLTPGHTDDSVSFAADDFLITGKRHDMRISYRAAVSEDGLIEALDVARDVKCSLSLVDMPAELLDLARLCGCEQLIAPAATRP